MKKITKEIIEKNKHYYSWLCKNFADFEDLFDTYYHILADLLMYPLAWCYVVWSKRGPGKTYSVLWLAYYCHFPIIYMKRTDKDVARILKEETIIEQRAFMRCESLASIVLPQSLTTIQELAFARCKSLTSITLPESVKTITGAKV